MKKIKCRCGTILDTSKGEKLTSYFHNENGMRLTVCDNCANQLGFNNEKKYSKVATEQLTEKQKLTPPKNAN